ncbi:hypothetical protein [Sphingorhabdus profundilacus]|uniref:hypothetical protein n=1 Tax=Sphingorhabdus profundilacus TaxID=2509718 RepID=UPI001365E852|nr:hypothetical protein [Sphingorhabdus profundilacus]
MRALCLLLLLGACQQDFDSQYAETEKKVKAAEAKIDAARAKQEKQEAGEER